MNLGLGVGSFSVSSISNCTALKNSNRVFLKLVLTVPSDIHCGTSGHQLITQNRIVESYRKRSPQSVCCIQITQKWCNSSSDGSSSCLALHSTVTKVTLM